MQQGCSAAVSNPLSWVTSKGVAKKKKHDFPFISLWQKPFLVASPQQVLIWHRCSWSCLLSLFFLLAESAFHFQEQRLLLDFYSHQQVLPLSAAQAGCGELIWMLAGGSGPPAAEPQSSSPCAHGLPVMQSGRMGTGLCWLADVSQTCSNIFFSGLGNHLVSCEC